ncbi:MAG: PAS domain S-box protein [Phycisphaerales bacterium]|nr:PAS domain S-box protein [Phycisphaerales bacterium]
MEWALVDRKGEGVGAEGVGASGVIARLPRSARTEFFELVAEACDSGERKRLSVSRVSQPLLFVDIVPLAGDGTSNGPALVVLTENAVDSQRERAHRLARRNEAILASSMDGFFVVDAECRFVEVNDAFCRMTGYAADELRRMRITDLEAPDARDTVPAHTRTGLHQFPVAHRHKDGRLLHLEVCLNVLHDEDQKILVGFARDISERLRAQDEIARLMRQRQLILDSTAEGIAEIDSEGRFVFLNVAGQRLLGATAGEAMRRSAHALLRGQDAAKPDCGAADCPICGVLCRGRSIARGVCATRRGGESVELAFTLTPMGAGHAASGAVLVMEDISERRRIERERSEMEERQRQAERIESMGLLAGGLAHDLNNTLVGVMGNASLGEGEAEDAKGCAESSKRANARRA